MKIFLDEDTYALPPCYGYLFCFVSLQVINSVGGEPIHNFSYGGLAQCPEQVHAWQQSSKYFAFESSLSYCTSD